MYYRGNQACDKELKKNSSGINGNSSSIAPIQINAEGLPEQIANRIALALQLGDY